MSEDKEAQLSIIYMYTQTGENAECEVLTQVSYVFYFSIFLEQNYFKMFDCFHHLSKSHINK